MVVNYVLLSGERSSQSKHPIRLVMVSRLWFYRVWQFRSFAKPTPLVHAQDDKEGEGVIPTDHREWRNRNGWAW
jgi:hypothetical protein